MEPYAAMLRWSESVAPDAAFVARTTEAMPYRSHSMPLLTAAGSLNWADLSLFFPEARRVVAEDGMLVVYALGQGRDLEFAMTETNVAAAVRQGVSESEIRRWCEDTLAPVFQGAAREVTFRGFIAYLCPMPPSAV